MEQGRLTRPCSISSKNAICINIAVVVSKYKLPDPRSNSRSRIRAVAGRQSVQEGVRPVWVWGFRAAGKAAAQNQWG